MDSNFFYSFPAIKGIQASREYFVIMCLVLCQYFGHKKSNFYAALLANNSHCSGVM